MDAGGSRAVARWQDLCLDAVDVAAQARFWSAVSGLDLADLPGDGAPARLAGPTSGHTIWVNPVDRPHRTKNRTHLDVDCASVDDLVALGATVLDAASETGLGWTVMADPEGNELCAFVRAPDDLRAYRLHGIGIDCVDPAALSRWWGDVLGAAPVHDPTYDCWTLAGVAVDERMTMDFAAVPEPRTEPNRLHWDVVGDVATLLDRGARHLWDQPRWTVLGDPEGNEFCAFPPS